MKSWRALTVVAGLLAPASMSAAGTDARTTCTADVAPNRAVHATETRIAAALADGLRRSATLRSLVGRIESLGGYVYLNGGACRRVAQGVVLDAGMSHDVKVAGGLRLIVITVKPGRGDRTIVSIGHELRHAVEVLESDAADRAAVRQLYARIGTEVHTGVFETEAAAAAQLHVARDLSRCKPEPAVVDTARR